MGQGIGWSQRRKSQRGGDGLLPLAGVAQGPDKAVVSLVMRRICHDGCAESLRRFSGATGGQQVNSALGESFGMGCVGLGHGSL